MQQLTLRLTCEAHENPSAFTAGLQVSFHISTDGTSQQLLLQSGTRHPFHIDPPSNLLCPLGHPLVLPQQAGLKAEVAQEGLDMLGGTIRKPLGTSTYFPLLLPLPLPIRGVSTHRREYPAGPMLLGLLQLSRNTALSNYSQQGLPGCASSHKQGLKLNSLQQHPFICIFLLCS